MFETLLSNWDGETLVSRYDRPTGAYLFIAIHSTRQGPGAGGTRLKHYANPEDAVRDALRLSAAMSAKFAVTDLPWGGGKGVIAAPPQLNPQARADLLRGYGRLVHQLGGLFNTGPDVGVNAQDLDIVAETGGKYVFGRPPESGGSGDAGVPTAEGVFAGLKVAAAHRFGTADLRGRRIVVQGAGSVGRALIELLLEAEAEVRFSDIDPEAVTHVERHYGLTRIEPDDVISSDCDIYAPCALGGVLSAETIPQLRCQVVAGAANNQLSSPEDAERLRARGILYAPDYILNVGGAMAILTQETQGWSYREAVLGIQEKVEVALTEVLALAEREGISTEAAAQAIVRIRLGE
jgi:glutamate dehydrogenase/leucine dehydrogenase